MNINCRDEIHIDNRQSSGSLDEVVDLYIDGYKLTRINLLKKMKLTVN
jgi:hypothetical protein